MVWERPVRNTGFSLGDCRDGWGLFFSRFDFGGKMLLFLPGCHRFLPALVLIQ